MSKKSHNEEQIPRALRQAESRTKVGDDCREHGISEATYYMWKKHYAGLAKSGLSQCALRLLL